MVRISVWATVGAAPEPVLEHAVRLCLVQLIEAPALQLYRYCRGAGGASKQQLLWLITWVRWSRSPFFNQYSDIQYVTVCREPEPELEELHQTMLYDISVLLAVLKKLCMTRGQDISQITHVSIKFKQGINTSMI
jgi:hypothetical protein